MQITVTRPSELGSDEIAIWHSMQCATASLSNPFLSPEFAVAVGRFQPDARVAVLTEASKIVGFFPFERRRLGLGVPLGAGLSDCQGLIHAPGVEWDPRQILRECRLSVWQFDHLVADQRPFARYQTATAPSPVIDLTDSFPAYYTKLQVKSPRFCRDLARQMRKLERNTGEELRFVFDSRDASLLRTLMIWKSDQYRRNGWLNVFDRPWVVGLLDALLATRTDQVSGFLSASYVGDQPVAAQFGLRSGKHFAGWFTAYNTDFGKYSPGLIQFMQMAEELAAAGVHLLDLGEGAGSYKDKLKSYDIFVARGVVTGRPVPAAAHHARSAVSDWARSRIRQHPLLFRAADQMLRHLGRIG